MDAVAGLSRRSAHRPPVRSIAALLLCLLALLACWCPAAAQNLQPVPALTARVIDQTATLDDIQRQGLVQKLAELEQAKGTQVVFLVVPTTQPEDIASYANRVANEWKIGRKAVGDGVLLVVAKNDRKVRIEVAKTLEGAIPDLAASQIIDEAVRPRFRAGDYTGGLHAAADQLIARINGEPLPPVRHAALDGFNWMDLAIFLFFAVPIAGAVLRGILGRKLGSLVTGGGVGAIALLLTSSIVIAVVAAVAGLLFSMVSGAGPRLGSRRHGGWGGGPIIGGGWGGGGGGGSWGGGGGWGGSGGGGDFGGGGASGDW